VVKLFVERFVIEIVCDVNYLLHSVGWEPALDSTDSWGFCIENAVSFGYLVKLI
jgi:hypothetical protein